MGTRITDIRAISTAPQAGCNLVVVRVDTNQTGLYGLGCATYTQRHLAVVQAVAYLKELLVGRDATAIEDTWGLSMHNPYWRNGPVLNNAVSGVDMALWDILGKEAGMPVWRLLGGKARKAVPVYRHANGHTIDELEDNVRAYMDKGYRYIRCQLNGYGGSASYLDVPDGPPDGAHCDARAYMRQTIHMFEELRARLGWDVELLHDTHERLSPIESVGLAKALEPFKLFFLEDVLPPEQVDWFARIRQATTTPIAMGELFNNPMEYKRLISERMIDFIRCHISQIGGLTPARKLAAFCEAFGVKTAWHGPGDVSPIGHACNVHLSLNTPNTGILEWCGTDTHEQINEVFSGVPQQKGSYVYANDLPGFGIDMDEEKAKKYPATMEVPRWTQTRLPDGSVVYP